MGYFVRTAMRETVFNRWGLFVRACDGLEPTVTDSHGVSVFICTVNLVLKNQATLSETVLVLSSAFNDYETMGKIRVNSVSTGIMRVGGLVVVTAT